MRPFAALLASNLLGAVVGGIFFLSATWSFGLAEMGRYALALAIQWLIAGLLGTALHVATVRLTVSYLAGSDRAAAGGVTALAAILAAAASLTGAVACGALGLLVPEGPVLPPALLALVILWAGGRSVLDCLIAGLLARQRYTGAAALVVSSAIAGLLALAAVRLGGALTLERLLVAHVLAMGTSAIAAAWIVRPRLALPRRQLRELLAYARWPALGEGLRLLQTETGPFIVVWLAGAAQAGIFGVARYPAVVFGVVAVSAYQYWLPTAAREAEEGGLGRFLGRQLRLAGLVVAGLLLGAIVARPALPWLGANFAAAASLFVPNAVDLSLLVLGRPINAVYHGLFKPHLELLWRACHLPFLAVGALLLVPRFGAAGMVWAQLLSSAVGLLLGASLLWRELDPKARREALDSLWRR
jgi:O-antigen/teichoic acid export membrane protein